MSYSELTLIIMKIKKRENLKIIINNNKLKHFWQLVITRPSHIIRRIPVDHHQDQEEVGYLEDVGAVTVVRLAQTPLAGLVQGQARASTHGVWEIVMGRKLL